jgi:hypothetical protein
LASLLCAWKKRQKLETRVEGNKATWQNTTFFASYQNHNCVAAIISNTNDVGADGYVYFYVLSPITANAALTELAVRVKSQNGTANIPTISLSSPFLCTPPMLPPCRWCTKERLCGWGGLVMSTDGDADRLVETWDKYDQNLGCNITISMISPFFLPPPHRRRDFDDY